MEQQTPIYVQFYNASTRLHRISKKLPPPCKDLSHFELMCLKIIYDYSVEHPDIPGIKPSTLSHLTKVSRPAMSQHINALEAKGCIQRVASQTDRRVTYLALSARGQELIQAQYDHLMRHLQTICDQLGHEDALTLIEITNKLCDIYLKITEQEQAQSTTEKGGTP